MYPLNSAFLGGVAQNGGTRNYRDFYSIHDMPLMGKLHQQVCDYPVAVSPAEGSVLGRASRHRDTRDSQHTPHSSSPPGDVRISGRANTPCWVLRDTARPCFGTPPAVARQLHSHTHGKITRSLYQSSLGSMVAQRRCMSLAEPVSGADVCLAGPSDSWGSSEALLGFGTGLGAFHSSINHQASIN
jgi:hypothetical protein